MQIKENEPLSKYTTFHIGGPAKYFVIVKNAEELREALKWAEEKGEKYFILGGGSNLLFSDNGFSGLVIKIAFMSVEIDGEEVIAGAGAPLLLVAKKAAEAGLAGIENLAGIPGTIGGAVCDNAGAYGGEIADAVQKAEILTVGSSTSYQLEQVDKNWFEFEYRKSKLKEWSRLNLDHQKPVILRVWLKLKNVGVQNS
ncbi:FAD-binding protein, partial [Patescibacteria group bacterium]|nr:FAD-binding protein [Patescibacteria group bacterium]